MTSLNKYWNTWNPNDFARMEHLAAGISIVPGAYSAAENAYSQFPFDKNTRLLEHESSGRWCRMRVTHAQAELEIEYCKPDPWTMLLRMTDLVPPREWGIRFHMLVSIGYENLPGVVSLSDGMLCAQWDCWHAAAAFLEPPYDIVLADTSAAVGDAMAGKGFKNTEDRSDAPARWGTCRFVLEQSPQVCVAVSIAHDAASAREKARTALEGFSRWDALRAEATADMPRSAGTAYPGMLDAVRDIMAWNDIYSPVLHRAYTTISRHWNGEFGGWFIFFSDCCYQVMLKAAAGDLEMASRNLDYVLTAATAEGNFAGMLCGCQKWVDRTQPPVLAYAVLNYCLASGDLTAAARAYPALRRAQAWYLQNRRAGEPMLISLGTGKTGAGDYRGTKVAAKNEAAMDNSPMYDEAEFDPETGLLRMYDVGASAQLALDFQCTARLAELLDKPEEARELERTAAAMAKDINAVLWDEDRGMYANRALNGTFGLASPTSFYPLAAGCADEARLERCLENIFDPAVFFTECPLIAIDARSAAARENRYWRGRTWAPQCYWTWLGLRRLGRDAEATRLAEACLKHFARHWNGERFAYENYNPFTGEGSDSVDSQAFYSWTALLPLMWTQEQFGADPWNGLCLGFPDGRPFRQENRYFAGKRYSAWSENGVTHLAHAGGEVFSSDIPTRFRKLRLEEHYASVTLDAPEAGTVSFPGREPRMVLLDGEAVPASAVVSVPAGGHSVELYD